MAQKVVRAPMPPSRRAKQFAMFDALKGLKEAIAAKERPTEPRKYLSEESIAELNKQLTELRKGQLSWLQVSCSHRCATVSRSSVAFRNTDGKG